MESKISPGILYEVDSRVAEHDRDTDGDEWSYGGREVVRGQVDPRYEHADVYWLYDDDIQRIGLAEHDLSDPTRFEVLWYSDNPFETLLQEPGWNTTEDTVWSLMPSHAYEYCLDHGITTPEELQNWLVRGDIRVVTPGTLYQLPTIRVCKCGLRSTGEVHCEVAREKWAVPNPFSVIFMDENCVIHEPPSGSRVWEFMQRHASGETRGPTQPAQASVQAEEHYPEPEHHPDSPQTPATH